MFGSKFIKPTVSSLVVHKRFPSSNYVSTLHFYTKKIIIGNVIGAPETFVDDLRTDCM